MTGSQFPNKDSEGDTVQTHPESSVPFGTIFMPRQDFKEVKRQLKSWGKTGSLKDLENFQKDLEKNVLINSKNT